MQTYPRTNTFPPGRPTKSSLLILSTALLLFTMLAGLSAGAPLNCEISAAV